MVLLVAVVDDYDLHVSHFLIQGCDVWMNNPRKPMEASGTSGMKAAINGTPHLSIGDGWWAEGFTGENGWLIEGQASPDDQGAQDWADAQDLYGLLETDIVPRFYERDADGLPQSWLKVMRRAMASGLWRFSSTRMLREYTESLYLPAPDTRPGDVAPEAAGSGETLADAAEAAASASCSSLPAAWGATSTAGASVAGR